MSRDEFWDAAFLAAMSGLISAVYIQGDPAPAWITERAAEIADEALAMREQARADRSA